MRVAVVAAVICLSVVGAAGAADARATIREPMTISAQPLGSALQELARERDFQLICNADLVRGLKTRGISGQFTPREALATLLTGTGLTYRYLDARTVTVVPLALQPDRVASERPPNGPASPTVSNTGTKEGKRISSRGFRVAQVAQGATGVHVGQEEKSERQAVQLPEVIVTAEKREERLQDVPVPVSVVNAADLIDNNQPRLQDYYAEIPGLTVTPNVGSQQILSIRGITTGTGTNPTVGITVDDVPYGSSTLNGGGQVVPDFDPSDLSQVEVLRGPQGTLYGASSMGGLIKFVTVDPSTDALTGRVEGGLSGVDHGDGPGYNVRGSINVPVSDTFAFRASAFTRQDPGYIDNPVLNIDGINEAHAYGGLLSALWRLSDSVSLKTSALYQDTRGDGSNDIDVSPGLGDLQQNYLFGAGGYDRKLQAYGATLAAQLGAVHIVSVTGYNVNSFSDSTDDTNALSKYTLLEFGVPGTPVFEDNRTSKITEELRLSGSIWDRIDWLLGGFYTHERSEFTQNILAEDPTTYADVGTWGSIAFPTAYREYAAFGDLTFYFGKRLDLQLGGRESFINQASMESNVGEAYDTLFLGAPSPVIYPELDTKASAFTYLATPQFRLSEDWMIYARLASGYRAGGPNAAPGVPREFDPDKTQNYELGTKGDFLEHRFSIDASIYYIDWTNIQIELLDPQNFQYYNGNGSHATSQGVEFSVEARPLPGLKLSAWASWNDAKLTEPFPVDTAAVGVSGSRLPFTARWSGYIAGNQNFTVTQAWTGTVGADLSYVGDREGDFASAFAASPVRQYYAPFARMDVHAGALTEDWALNLYVNNVTDRRGVLSGGLGYIPPFAFTYIQPRTAGITVTRTF